MSINTRILLASLTLLLPVTLLGAKDDAPLRVYNPTSRLVYYRDPEIVMQAARFEIPRPGELERVTITLGGARGTATVHVFGYEAGLPAPIIERDLVTPIRITKTRAGVERITVELRNPAHIDHHHFFVAVDHLAPGVVLLSDNEAKTPSCSSPTDRYLFQFLKYADGGWRSGAYAYAIEATVTYAKAPPAPRMVDARAGATDEEIADDSIRWNRGIAWGDIDRDGDLDLLFDGRLRRNDGNGTFTDVTASAGLSGAPRAQLFIDADNDGYPDILFLGSADSSMPAAALFINDTHGGFTRRELELRTLTDPTSFAVADADGDDHLDLFVGQSAGDGRRDHLLLNDAGHGFRDGGSLLAVDSGASGCAGAAWVEVDRDGRLELYVVRENGLNELWRRGKDGVYGSEIMRASRGARVAGCDWRDYDGDGAPDLLLPAAFLPRPLPRASIADGAATDKGTAGDAAAGGSIYRNAGAPAYELAPGGDEIERDTRQAGGAWGDVNNDRLPDFVMTTSSECRYLSICEQTPDHRFETKTFDYGLERVAAGPDAVWVDYDNDGLLDLATVADGRLRLFRNTGTYANRFVELDVSRGGASAVGAEATVYAGGVAQTQGLASGNGLLMQRPMRLHFGLGQAGAIDSVVVRWNDGRRTTERFTGVPVDAIYRVGAGSSTTSAGTVSLAASPNPFTSLLTITYALPEAGQVRLAIYSLQGELVATLVDEAQPAGEHAATWEARGNDGKRLPQGVYNCRLTTPDGEIARKVVLAH